MPIHFNPTRTLACVLAAFWAASASAQDDDVMAEGKRVFTSAVPPCQICHTLEDAGATGAVGPNLDDLQPTEEQVREAVRGGVGAMPAYRERLSEEEIDAVSRYVAQVTGG